MSGQCIGQRRGHLSGTSTDVPSLQQQCAREEPTLSGGNMLQFCVCWKKSVQLTEVWSRSLLAHSCDDGRTPMVGVLLAWPQMTVSQQEA